ncbi:hypothetical protein BGZ83_007562 [Gryganskiella cystojenkinii]|nr:hypothetical protein BGZ83_007562 [Gryganskiella cystojenkinii]
MSCLRPSPKHNKSSSIKSSSSVINSSTCTSEDYMEPQDADWIEIQSNDVPDAITLTLDEREEVQQHNQTLIEALSNHDVPMVPRVLIARSSNLVFSPGKAYAYYDA